MIAIGIDPGLTGAIAAVNHRGLRAVHDMPTMTRAAGGFVKNQVNVAALCDILRSLTEDEEKQNVIVGIELPIAMPGQHAASTMVTGLTSGMIEGAVVARGYPHVLVTAAAWKKAMDLTLPKVKTQTSAERKKASKELSRSRAQRLYPEAPLSSMLHHNRAEAILLARYFYDLRA